MMIYRKSNQIKQRLSIFIFSFVRNQTCYHENIFTFSWIGIPNDTYTGPDQQYYKGAWGVYPLLPSGNILVSDMQSGLFIVEGPGDNCYSSQATAGPDVSCRTTLATASSLLKDIPNVFPQPATAGRYLTISGLNLAFRSDWRLTRIDGSLLKTWTEAAIEEQVEIELPENLAPGIYFLSIVAQNEATVLPVSIH